MAYSMITYPSWAGAVADLGSVISASGATTTQISGDIHNANFRGIKVFLNTTSVTTSVTLTIQGKDSQSGVYYTILAGAAVLTSTLNVYTVFPAATAATNVAANDFLPAIFNISVATVGASTYTVGAVLM